MKKSVIFISSEGGHLSELLNLSSCFDKYNYHIITEETKATAFLYNKYKGHVDYLPYETKLHPIGYFFILIVNTLLSLFYFLKYRPEFIVTTGTHTAAPMCLIAKIFGAKVIYIETFANIHSRTVTGSFLYFLADLFIVQWEDMLKRYPKATYGGWIF